MQMLCFAHSLPYRATRKKPFKFRIDRVVRNHRPIAVESSTNRYGGRKTLVDFRPLRGDTALRHLLPLGTAKRIASDSRDDVGRSAQFRGYQGSRCHATARKSRKARSLHLLAHSRNMRKVIKNKIDKKFAEDQQASIASHGGLSKHA